MQLWWLMLFQWCCLWRSDVLDLAAVPMQLLLHLWGQRV